jgi:hypothetical protein
MECDSINDILMPPEYSPVRWLPGVKIDQTAPEYLMVSQRPRGLLDDVNISSLVVKIGDLGAGKEFHARRKSSKAETLNSRPQWRQFFCSSHALGPEGP